MDEAERSAMAANARARVDALHSGTARAIELERHLLTEGVWRTSSVSAELLGQIT
jgi:hypothetical protein